VTMR